MKMMRLVLAVCAAGALIATAFAGRPAANGAPTKLLRMPTVSATQIAFAYANNIWTVERAGGIARRLTSFQGQTTNPHFSPDGKWIAFSGEYAGNVDVYVVAGRGRRAEAADVASRRRQRAGMDARRQVDRLLLRRVRPSAPSGAPRFWTVPVEGGVEEPMPLPRAYQGKISPDGTHIAYRMNNSWDEERRNYRGGQNRPIWIVDLKTYDLVSPPWTDSKDMDPVWVGDTVYFLSDRDGVVQRLGVRHQVEEARAGDEVHRLRRQVDGRRPPAPSCSSRPGYIHELDPKSGREHVVTITAAGDFPWMMPRWEDVTARMTNLAPVADGQARRWSKRAARSSRSPRRRATSATSRNSSGSAERDPAWSPDGKYVSYFSDKSGEYKLVIEAQDGLTPPREITLEKPTHYYTPSWSPDSKKICLHRHQPERVGHGRRERQGEDCRQRSVDGAAADAESGRGARIRNGSRTPRTSTRSTTRSSSATSRPARRSRSPTAWRTRCGRCGTRAASISGSSRPPTSDCVRSGST